MQGWLMGGTATDRVSDRLILSALLMIWAILVLAAGTAQGNTRNRPAPSIRFNRITTADGLTSNNINDLLQDRLGLLWFATDDGLNRFDGYDMRIFRTIPGNENSLADNSVSTLAEDRAGRIWIGTKSGAVQRYDPAADRFSKWDLKTGAVKENAITAIYEENENAVWIGTYRDGLYRLDPVSGQMAHWHFIPGDPASLSSDYVTSIVADPQGNIWIGTYHGLNRLPSGSRDGSEKITRFFAQKENPGALSDDIVWNLTRSEHDPGLIWIGTADGLTRYHAGTGAFSKIHIPNPDDLQFGASAGSVIEEMNAGESILWIDSFAGLIRFNRDMGRFDRFVPDDDNPHSLAHSHINGMIRDRSGVLWVATENGLCFFPSRSQKFNNTLSREAPFINAQGLAKNVTAMARTGEGRIWFGTEEGLYYTDAFSAHPSNSSREIKRDSGSAGLNIWSLASCGGQELWIGTYGSGLFRRDLKTSRLRSVQAHDKKITIPAIQYNKALWCDQQNNLWIGYWGLGLARLDPVTGAYRLWLHDPDDPRSLSHNDVWVLFQDSRDRLWIGTNGGGLNLFSEENGGSFSHWFAGEGRADEQEIAGGVSSGALNSNSIYAICEGKRGKKSLPADETVLWIGTSGGLNKLVVQDGGADRPAAQAAIITSCTTADGLANNSIKTILEDDNGNLWLGTAAGISFFNTEDGEVINYDESDGLLGVDFNSSSALNAGGGMMLMGSTSGLNCFDPRTITRSLYRPPVVLADFHIFNTPVAADDPALNGQKSSLYAKEITLSHRQNVFSFQLAALDYNAPAAIEYAYMMEGFDAGWVDGGTRRYVTYTNLNPGRYTFKARATNSDGVWNDQVTGIRVTITPPWWQTGWAILLYLLIFAGSTYGLVRFQAHRTKTQAMLRMQELEFAHLREVENMKSRFFANLSHEFRTPLTLMKGPLEQLINGKIRKNRAEYYRMLYRNAGKLQRLIDQLLELSQLEAATIPLHLEQHDLVHLLRGIADSFKPLAAQKEIELIFRPDRDSLAARLDRDKFEKIINNLLSNAFKFTPAGGRIAVELRCEQPPASEHPSAAQTAVISIIDSGIGIPEEDQANIFNRFFQVDDSSKRSYGGSGIGLALVKELATLHQWEISVSSRAGEGSAFVLKIPLDEELQTSPAAAEDGEAGAHAEGQGRRSRAPVPGREVPESAPDAAGPADAAEALLAEAGGMGAKDGASSRQAVRRPKILIVDDSADLRFFLAGLLEQEYETVQAENAVEGIALAGKSMPDLILSDVMMPGVDGLEFCHRLKTGWQTSHIPVILLTARALPDDKIRGLETGADDYITKPFDADELLARINNLVDQRRRLREKIRQELNLQPEPLAANAVEKEFMQRLLLALEESLADEGFDSERLAQKMFVSRSQLHRKLRAITGQAPGEFIRMYKLKRAAQMITENKISITQIAFEVGFGSPAQFSRAFRKYFSCLPSEYTRRTTSPG